MDYVLVYKTICHQQLTELNLFEHIEVGNTHIQCRFKIIPFTIYILFNSKTKFYWYHTVDGVFDRDSSFDEVLMSAPEDIQTKLLFNIDLFR